MEGNTLVAFDGNEEIFTFEIVSFGGQLVSHIFLLQFSL
jgi:hypothetical protein